MLQNVIQPVISNVINPLLGLDGAILPKFIIPLQISLAVQKGIGTYDFSNISANDTRSVIDAFSIIHTDILSQEARLQGVRRVRNILNEPVYTDWTAAPTGGATAVVTDLGDNVFNYDITLPNTATYELYTPAQGNPVGNDVTVTYEFRVHTFPSDIQFFQIDDATGSTGYVEVGPLMKAFAGDGEWHRLCPTVGGTIDHATQQWIEWKVSRGAGSTTGVDFDVRRVQIEDVTGQTIQEPSEYVSVGVATGSEENPDTGLTEETNWDDSSINWLWTSGNLGIFKTVAGYAYAYAEVATLNLAIGRQYLVTYTVENFTLSGGAGDAFIGSYGSVAQTITGDGTFTAILRDDRTLITQDALRFAGQGDGNPINYDITYVSVKEIDHGSNVDGVRYEDTHNTLAVKDNIVYGTGGRGVELSGDGTTIFDVAKTWWNQDGSGVWAFTSPTEIIITTAFSTITVNARAPIKDAISVGDLVEIEWKLKTIGTATLNFKVDGVLIPTIVVSTNVWTTIKAVFVSPVANASMKFHPSLITAASISLKDVSIKVITPASSYADGTKFGRRVENLFTDTDLPSLTDANWFAVSGGTMTDGVLVASAANSGVRHSDASFNVIGGRTYAISFEMTVQSGAGDWRTGQLGTATFTGATYAFTASGTTQRFCRVMPCTASGTVSIRFVRTTAVASTVLLDKIQFEDITDTEDLTIPSEYTSVDTQTFPYSGTGLDGIAEFPRINPNSIDGSGIVSADQSTYPRTPGDGVLIEGARENKIPDSIDLSGLGTQSGATVTADQDIAPDGGTATQLTLTTTANSAGFDITASLAAGTYAISIYVKRVASAGDFRLSFWNATDGILYSADLEATDEWQRFEITLTSTVATTNFYIVNKATTAADLYIWGFQVEEASFSSSLIPTSGSAVIAVADTLEYDKLNYTPEGTFVIDFVVIHDPNDGAIQTIINCADEDDALVNVSVAINTIGKLVAIVADLTGPAHLYSETAATALSIGRHRLAFGYTQIQGDRALYIDGIRADATPTDTGDTDVTQAKIDHIGIGHRDVTGSHEDYLNGTVSLTKRFNKRLDNDWLEANSKL